jgi:hypothetical protein
VLRRIVFILVGTGTDMMRNRFGDHALRRNVGLGSLEVGSVKAMRDREK